MSSIDYGRKQDLEELAESMENAKSKSEADYYKRIMYRVLNESDDIRYWREQLIQAVRVNDSNRKNYVIAKIQKIRQDETNGKSWGQDKGEKYVN